jgi:hypothetical protein
LLLLEPVGYPAVLTRRKAILSAVEMMTALVEAMEKARATVASEAIGNQTLLIRLTFPDKSHLKLQTIADRIAIPRAN